MALADTMDRDTGLDWQNRSLPMHDTPELRAALHEGNPQTLLMVYVHLTRDEAMLDLFSAYIKSPYAQPPGVIPEEYLEELREKLLHVLVTPGAAVEGDPDDRMMQRMMTVGVAEPVEDEFLPLLFDQIGFKPQPVRKHEPGRTAPPPDFKVLVIGAGLTGLGAAIKLGEAGYDYVVIEKNEDVGGTWWENRYPGVGVDTPSHFYSYSFEISPEWTHYHPRGDDMFKYLEHVANKYALRQHIRFGTRVTSLVYDDRANVWDVTMRGRDGAEEVIRANAVINAHGPVNRFRWPDIAGLEDFAGPRLHTATWDPSVDLKGKRVAVIGTGASAAQLIPAIADEVSALTIFMRTRHWSISSPAGTDEVSDGVKFALRHIPHYREWFRFRIYWFAADGLFPNVLKDPDWPADSPSVSAVNDAMRQFALSYLESSFHDRPDLKEKMTPDFPIFSKRIVIDRGPYFPALKKPNVTLEDRRIARILPHGIEMADGAVHEIDVLVCATGFDVANMMGDLEIVGRDGRRLRDEWGTEDARAYFGLMVTGYPNYFHTTGPNSAPNHAAGQNLISERQVNYAIECLDWVNAEGVKALEPTREAFEAWNDQITERMKQMIWTHPKANSYYNNSKGRPYLSWPYRLVDLWVQSQGPRKEDFALL
jgi:4-hydroxyacetophenone monooxygenase